MRHALHRGRAGADDADALVLETGEAAMAVAARIVIVPTAGVKGMALERLDAGNAGELGTMQGSVRHNDEARLHGVVAIGPDDPARDLVIPAHLGHFGLEADIAIEIELARDGAAVFEDLRRAGIFLDRHVADFFEQRQINVGFDVAGRARIPVPVPGAAVVAALLDHAEVLDAGLAQPRAGEQAAEAAADHHDFDFVGQWCTRKSGLDIGIIEVMREVALDLAILLVAVRTQALVALREILFLQRGRIKAELFLPGFCARFRRLRHRSRLPGELTYCHYA